MSVVLKPEIFLADPGGQFCCGYGNVAILRTLGPPDQDLAKRWASAVSKYGRTFAHGIGLIVVIDSSARVPTDAERSTISDALAAVAPVVRGAVDVVEGKGFGAAAMRGAITVINLAKSVGYPVKVASDFTEATTILQRLLGASLDPRIDAAGLVSADDMLRSVVASARQARGA